MKLAAHKTPEHRAFSASPQHSLPGRRDSSGHTKQPLTQQNHRHPSPADPSVRRSHGNIQNCGCAYGPPAKAASPFRSPVTEPAFFQQHQGCLYPA
ncbi:hypothetical protein ECNE098_2570, partial [Escherichia coli NE098]